MAMRPGAVVGFDSASTISFATLNQFWQKGGRYVELYEKYSTPALCTTMHNIGFAIGLIFETTAERSLGGYMAGYSDAEAFIAAAPARLGTMPPATVAPAWAADFDVTAAQMGAVLRYAQGWSDGLKQRLARRVYGNGATCQACKQAKFVDYTWVAGGMKMRGTLAFITSGQEDEYQEVGDEENVGFSISVDDDVAGDPTLPWCWHK